MLLLTVATVRRPCNAGALRLAPAEARLALALAANHLGVAPAAVAAADWEVERAALALAGGGVHVGVQAASLRVRGRGVPTTRLWPYDAVTQRHDPARRPRAPVAGGGLVNVVDVERGGGGVEAQELGGGALLQVKEGPAAAAGVLGAAAATVAVRLRSEGREKMRVRKGGQECTWGRGQQREGLRRQAEAHIAGDMEGMEAVILTAWRGSMPRKPPAAGQRLLGAGHEAQATV